MCGRYALHARPEVIALQFGVPPTGRFAPRYNVAPGTLILVVADGAQRRLENDDSRCPALAWLGVGASVLLAWSFRCNSRV